LVHHRFLENVLKEQQPQRGLIIDSRRFGRSMARLTCGGEGEKGLIFKSVRKVK
jgi:hypothetical protein